MTKDQVEIQNLRTKINLYKKALDGILWDIDHLHEEPYDYGEAKDGLVQEIKQRVINCKYRITEVK